MGWCASSNSLWIEQRTAILTDVKYSWLHTYIMYGGWFESCLQHLNTQMSPRCHCGSVEVALVPGIYILCHCHCWHWYGGDCCHGAPYYHTVFITVQLDCVTHKIKDQVRRWPVHVYLGILYTNTVELKDIHSHFGEVKLPFGGKHCPSLRYL